MREGWYLMSIHELEQALPAWRAGEPVDVGRPLTIEEALEIRNAGNVPDDEDRSLRLVLFVQDEPLEQKRLRYEPDYHRAPDWRRDGSRPVNVVPLRTPTSPPATTGPWWDLPRVRELEEEWRATGAVAGIQVPADYRSFVFKTVIALQDAGLPITPSTIGDSVARWLTPEDAQKIRSSLRKKGPGI